MLATLLLMSFLQADEPSRAQIAQAVADVPAARRALDDLMFDYPSARFRNVYITVNLDTDAPRRAYLCGFVNGKNRMGAYAGWTRFSAAGDFVQLKSDDDVASLIVDAACGEGGNHAADTVDRSALLAHR